MILTSFSNWDGLHSSIFLLSVTPKTRFFQNFVELTMTLAFYFLSRLYFQVISYIHWSFSGHLHQHINTPEVFLSTDFLCINTRITVLNHEGHSSAQNRFPPGRPANLYNPKGYRFKAHALEKKLLTSKEVYCNVDLLLEWYWITKTQKIKTHPFWNKCLLKHSFYILKIQ